MTRSADVDRDGRIALHQAVVHGQLAEIARLIAEGQDVAAADKAGLTPLHMAAIHNRSDAARLLVAARAPIDARDAYGNTPLSKAVFGFQGGDPELIRLLLDAGADPDSKNNTDRSPRDLALIFDRPGIRKVFPQVDADTPGNSLPSDIRRR